MFTLKHGTFLSDHMLYCTLFSILHFKSNNYILIYTYSLFSFCARTIYSIISMANSSYNAYIYYISHTTPLKGKWQQEFLSFHLNETPKLYIEVLYRIFVGSHVVAKISVCGFHVRKITFLIILRSLRNQEPIKTSDIQWGRVLQFFNMAYAHGVLFYRSSSGF